MIFSSQFPPHKSNMHQKKAVKTCTLCVSFVHIDIIYCTAGNIIISDRFVKSNRIFLDLTFE